MPLNPAFPRSCPPLRTCFQYCLPLLPCSLTFLHRQYHVLHPWPSSYPIPPTLNMQVLTTASVWPTGVPLLLHRTQAALSGPLTPRQRQVYTGWRGWGHDSPLTQHHHDLGDTGGESRYVVMRVWNAISVCSQSVLPFSSIYSLTHTCLRFNKSVCCYKFYVAFLTWPHHTKTLFACVLADH